MKLYKIDKSGCWVWKDGVYITGYGQYKRGYAHRVFYELHKGVITSNHHIHHLCHNKLCVNPDHLVQLTRNEHNKIHHQLERQTCRHGHAMNPENTYITKDGHYQCKTCNRVRQSGYNNTRAQPIRNKRLEIIDGIRKDFGTMPVKELAKKYNVGWRSIYRYTKNTPKKLGYF